MAAGSSQNWREKKGYLQVPVKEEDIPKMAVITPFGLFEFTRMLFGLKNAGITFQRMMDQIFFDLPMVFVYLDDLLVASSSVEEHKHHLRQVLALLAKRPGYQRRKMRFWAAVPGFSRPRGTARRHQSAAF
jgi:hypothetical protein